VSRVEGFPRGQLVSFGDKVFLLGVQAEHGAEFSGAESDLLVARVTIRVAIDDHSSPEDSTNTWELH
jgi:hypothetical protein